ncbi:MAG TPA: hypothetical protein DCX19_05305, partial [Alphaproteobacteria bacterium]|nr:hypothetical protein [Alphaproteobacteria bacterium]
MTGRPIGFKLKKRRNTMKKYILPLMLACLAAFPVQAKEKADRLERKIAEIEREYREDVAE